MEDEKIIELYFERDESAIEKTAEKYGKYLFKIAYNILYDSATSEECLNDTYYKTWKCIPPTRPKIFSAFLAKITRNTALDKWRHDRSAKRGNLSESLNELSECIGEERIVSELEISELGRLISEFLFSEREIYRKIFVKRYFYGESVAEIAKFYSLTESNVKTSLSRTRLRLKEYLSTKEVKI